MIGLVCAGIVLRTAPDLDSGVAVKRIVLALAVIVLWPGWLALSMAHRSRWGRKLIDRWVFGRWAFGKRRRDA
ncbi:hypothetical protein [Actinokineospora alba]|uniref:hypothetical protein n=1 Tax=Actinokineospora alba TaxID=504798 RepID=UPI00105E485E|nr:hypothetical protein [Actinokineospora alba]